MSAIGVRLQYAPANVRALIVNALTEKAEGDRKAADADGVPLHVRHTLLDQAELAEQVAYELEGA